MPRARPTAQVRNRFGFGSSGRAGPEFGEGEAAARWPPRGPEPPDGGQRTGMALSARGRPQRPPAPVRGPPHSARGPAKAPLAVRQAVRHMGGLHESSAAALSTVASFLREDSDGEPLAPPRLQPFDRLLDHHLGSLSRFLSAEELASRSRDTAPSKGPGQSQWHEDMPPAILFARSKPSSRADAAILDRWITSAFTGYAQRSQQMSLSGEVDDEEELSRAVEELVPILSIGLHEIVSQVIL